MPVDPAVVDNNWSQTCWKTLNCAVLAENNNDVSLTLKTIHGGHSPNPGWSSIDEPGILIDLQKLNQISVSDDRKVVSIGPGQRWGAVYEALDAYSVSVIGACIPSVGVGGSILRVLLYQAYFFHFPGKYGLGADNVKNFEVVLADGSIVNANAHSNTDLLWALKGGSPNFACISAFASWQKTSSSDTASTVAMIITLDAITLCLLYAAPTVPPSVFAAFGALPAPLVVAVPPATGTSPCSEPRPDPGIHATANQSSHDYRGISSGVDADLYKDVYAMWKETATALRASTGANMTFVLQPIPAAMAEASKAAGGNPMGTPAKTHQWWTTLVDWTSAADDAAVRAAPMAVTTAWKKNSAARGLDVPHIFMNNASRDQNPLASYGAANVQKPKKIAEKSDPKRVFQDLQNGGFLLRDP
ncbi:FAD-binding domain-containing protein [Bimuria novae-zelandiae CBS 107.79]|uniref:FAD-binding domain-containing protein n=1 Tax=Bimuria novae-zelandiae CBS 107.79 TaxID=1447943 RepID=A0A6A5VZC8_9PLEO|nr:FAD-binding domain-containing protein [Bimuria novae-zelandiae CBS 107.79]